MANRNEKGPALVKGEPEMTVFREFEHAMHDMERRLDRVVRDADDAFPFPLLQGLALQRDTQGRLRFQPFGHIHSLDKLLEGWREPLLTWNMEGKTIVFKAEVPGARKADLNVEVTRTGLRIEADSGTTRYKAECNAGCAIDPQSAQASYQDGVLTVSCSLADTKNAKARKLEVR